MRLFLGIEPPPNIKLQIEHWRTIAFPELPESIPMDNFHITLYFFGEIKPTQLEFICQQKNAAMPITIKAKEVGYFSKPGIGFLAIEPNNELLQLQQTVQKLNSSYSTAKASHNFVPHISLFRNLLMPMPAPLISPDIQFQSCSYHLYESIRHKNRVSYRIINSWNSL